MAPVLHPASDLPMGSAVTAPSLVRRVAARAVAVTARAAGSSLLTGMFVADAVRRRQRRLPPRNT